MSFEEETEVRDLMIQTLEMNGCLPKIRAQLRASLFHSLDEDLKVSKSQPMLNTKLKSQLEEPEGQLMFCLVREFLEYFDLDFTISVYEPESLLGSCYKYEGRQKIIEDLGLKVAGNSGPVLLHLIKIAQMKSKTLKINLTNLNAGEGVSNGSSSVSSIKDEVNGHSGSEGEESSVNVKDDPNVSQGLQINSTFVVKKTDNVSNYVKENGVDCVKKDAENDDTFNGTSSIEEETADNEISQTMVASKEDSHISQSPEFRSKSEDKSKSVKSDKLKSRFEVPPVDLNKTFKSDLLPSFYSKDFKEKKEEFDFEIKDDYEEDFMSGSEMELSQSKIDSPVPQSEELNPNEYKK